MQVTKKEARILYILAKTGEPTRKTILSQATARWDGEDRNRVLEALETRELIGRQSTPGKMGQPPGNYYWLTNRGIEAVEILVDGGVLKLEPEWRQRHGTEEREVLPGSGSV